MKIVGLCLGVMSSIQKGMLKILTIVHGRFLNKKIRAALFMYFVLFFGSIIAKLDFDTHIKL